MSEYIEPEQRVFFSDNELAIIGNGINVLKHDIQELKGDFLISAETLAQIIPAIQNEKAGAVTYYNGRTFCSYIGDKKVILDEINDHIKSLNDTIYDLRKKYSIAITGLNKIKKGLKDLPAFKRKLAKIDEILREGENAEEYEKLRWQENEDN